MPAFRLDAADRLVRTLEAGGALPPAEAGRILLAHAGGPPGLVAAVLDRVVADDARLDWRGDEIVLAAAPAAGVPLDTARFCVLDLETTGFGAGRARILELGAVLLAGGRPVRELELEVGASGTAARCVRRLLAFAGDAVLAGHNVRFDLAFLDHEAHAALGGRLAAPVVDTLTLARRLLRGRVERLSLAALADFVGSPDEPCHRALPDARATAWVLAYLVELARDEGARTVDDLCALGRMPVRRGR